MGLSKGKVLNRQKSFLLLISKPPVECSERILQEVFVAFLGGV